MSRIKKYPPFSLCSLDQIFWAGDAIVTGSATVILAMDARKNAANYIHHHLLSNH
jgi:NADPH-dependent glutamate synthase beta subunit-like oxidoreductase